MSGTPTAQTRARDARRSGKYPARPEPADLQRARTSGSQPAKPTDEKLTKRAATSISRLVLNPHRSVPSAAKKSATWFAPRRPSTFDSRPYSGVNVQVASRNAVPSQDAWFERLKSDEMEESTGPVRRSSGVRRTIELKERTGSDERGCQKPWSKIASRKLLAHAYCSATAESQIIDA